MENNLKKLSANELRQLWLDFYKQRAHQQIGSASLIPENDPSVLFTTAGMHPLVPYLLGAAHPKGKRLVNAQKCIRTGDIDEVGDDSHLTFFEMLGNWSLGDFFKREQIEFCFKFLTDKKYLNIPKERLAVSVFAGDDIAPRDEFSASVWLECGLDSDRIFYLPAKNNWWGLAGKGPCGPDTEMFIDNGQAKCSPECSPSCDCGKYLEIWNSVFMEYYKNEDGSIVPLAQKNVDTGMGLERTICTLQGKKSVYDTELFVPLIDIIEANCTQKYDGDEDDRRAMRIVCDHIRAAVFILGDERAVSPSNSDQGYILRRLIRRAVRFGRKINLNDQAFSLIAKKVIELYFGVYNELAKNSQRIIGELEAECQRFEKTLNNGLKEFEKAANYAKEGVLHGKTVFRLYDTYGFPPEMTDELAKERGLKADLAGYEECFKEHQLKSQAGAEQKFKGGLADSGEQTARLHTATHLMLHALRQVLGDEVQQRGSNITAERLRFDFNFGRKMEEHEIRQVEQLVNEAIKANREIICEKMTVEQAKNAGAIGVFDDKYGDLVMVYTMGEFSKEICGGPHAKNTGELGKFVIQKEQSSSSGVRRIKAVLQ